MGQSKTRTWANDDDMAKPSAVTAPVINQPVQENTQTEELPSHPKKAKTEKPPVAERVQQPEPIVIDKSGEEENQEESEQDNSAEPEAEAAPVSDADWLRSKTSRLLGLLDEEEQDEFDQHKAEAPADSASPSSSAGDKSPPVGSESRTEAIENIAPNMTDVDSEPQGAPEAPEDPNLDLIRNSARLFLRNLAYDTTEADLQPLFERFGKIEEVSPCSICFYPAQFPKACWLFSRLPSAQMMIFPIGTSDAKADDVTWTRDFSRCFLTI